MFQFKTDMVTSVIDEKISHVDDVFPYLEGRVGDTSNVDVNVLLSRFKNTDNTVSVFIVSEYAATQFAVRCGPNFVQSLVASTGAQDNPALCWLASRTVSIAHGGFSYKVSQNAVDILKWEQSKYARIRHNKRTRPPLSKTSIYFSKKITSLFYSYSQNGK